MQERTALHDWIVTCVNLEPEKQETPSCGMVAQCTADYAFTLGMSFRTPGKPCRIGIRAVDTDPL